jgi:hypothetical protein
MNVISFVGVFIRNMLLGCGCNKANVSGDHHTNAKTIWIAVQLTVGRVLGYSKSIVWPGK